MCDLIVFNNLTEVRIMGHVDEGFFFCNTPSNIILQIKTRELTKLRVFAT